MVDWFLGLLTSNEWDALRNWLATIGGLVALLIAANTYSRNVRIKREEQARLVYSRLDDLTFHDTGADFPMNDKAGIGTSGGGVAISPTSTPGHGRWLAVAPAIQAIVVVHNGSKELIGPIKVQMVNGGNDAIWDTFSIQVDAIEPESDKYFEFTWHNEFHPGQPALATTVLFRDASGQWWRRHRAEPVERVHDDPENVASTPSERAAWARNARAMGVEASPEPKASPRARWHRYWRRRRGKSPIP
ncbi:hypothetical protein [Microterricola viridarii]|uniref:Uncharacterized protein n=1 Tax=Microterricola viridarii TaxID=412690 RepID=A0A1H1SYY0_9MICO|nr:hypothetical protein [Microterricola viridarii]SDS53247.1 hypothetical protein SAMN04489834_1653 [Microterricola viridarii]